METWDEKDWAWFVANRKKDQEELADLIKTIFDVLKPWLNNEIYWKLKEKEEKDKREAEEGVDRDINAVIADLIEDTKNIKSDEYEVEQYNAVQDLKQQLKEDDIISFGGE